MYTLRNRAASFREVKARAVTNWEVAGDGTANTHTFVVVPGAPGIGKSCFGYEVPNFLRKTMTQFVVKNILIDFNNGQRFVTDFDETHIPTVRLGVRLASAGLVAKNFSQMLACGEHVYTAFSTERVLEAFLNETEEDDKPVALVLHFDEFQIYVDHHSKGRTGLDDMLRVLGDFMAKKHPGVNREFFILPVLTGTAAKDVHFLNTDRYTQVTLLLEPLDRHSAMQMVEQAFPDQARRLFNQPSFLIALGDTGYVPRIVAFLLGVKHYTDDYDWGVRLSLYYGKLLTPTLEQFGGEETVRAVIHFALSAQLVKRESKLPGHNTSTNSIGGLERAGHIYLVPASDGYFRVFVPFAQLVQLNKLLICYTENGPLPQHLLFSPSSTNPWRWQDFEQLHARFQMLRIRALLTARKLQINAGHNGPEERLEDAENLNRSFQMREICPGALGHPTTLALRVVVDETGDCFNESHKWVPNCSARPAVSDTVNCDKRKAVPLVGNVFLCKNGNTLFDGRFALRAAESNKAVLVVWQDKHTELRTNNPLNAKFIKQWHEQSIKVMEHWTTTYTVVYMFLTNRRLTDKLGELPEGLLVVTQEQLRTYLTGTLAERGLAPFPDEAGTGATAEAPTSTTKAPSATNSISTATECAIKEAAFDVASAGRKRVTVPPSSAATTAATSTSTPPRTQETIATAFQRPPMLPSPNPTSVGTRAKNNAARTDKRSASEMDTATSPVRKKLAQQPVASAHSNSLEALKKDTTRTP